MLLSDNRRMHPLTAFVRVRLYEFQPNSEVQMLQPLRGRFLWNDRGLSGPLAIIMLCGTSDGKVWYKALCNTSSRSVGAGEL